jgi:TonB family protein
VPDEVQDGSVDDLLDHARGAMLDRRYTDPPGDNALTYFHSVLALQPENDEAREGLQRIGAVVEQRFRAALAQRKFDDAARAIAELRLVRADDATLAQLGAQLASGQIETALANGNVERAGLLLRQAAEARTLPPVDLARWRDELNRRAGDSRAQVYSNLVATRIREGKLLEPANDSARLYLSMLRKLPSDPKGVASIATEELQQAFLDKAQRAASRSQRAELELWLNEARALGASPTRIAAIMRGATLPPVVRSTPPEAARPPPIQEERIAAAQVASKPEQRAVIATEPKRVHYVAPDYPQEALQKKLRGEVRVKITVGSDGKVRDAGVVSSNPSGVFDRAALAAVRRWRYQPGEVDGAAVEATLMTSIIFQPDTKRTP